ncbi:helix-turn-helix domain-containing protein [Myxosarcina sp. GI1]|uniref:helix-turn-helix domain-containing protein n=1 Tax=Myxosarcina sp. GI1 TaxID=1541065 RepID=UPI00055F9D12|nr:helix-turn-helix domain-containing protein [Myxosarcina sp. GI1]
MATLERQNKLPMPSEEEKKLSTESSRILASIFDTNSATQLLTVKTNSGEEKLLTIPTVAYELMIEILSEIAQGNAVTIVPIEAELTTQQAANILNVSRPYLTKLLDSGEIPHYKVGQHRRVLAEEVYKYKAEIDARRSKSLDELTSLSEELELYDES